AGQGYLYNHNMRFFRYDPDQNIWHKLANRPASYDTHRIFSAVYNNKVYMGYGRNSEDVYSCPGIRDWWVFDAGQNCDADSSPSLNCWTERVATAPNRIDALGFTLGKKIYFGLGIDYTGCRKGIEVKLQDWWAYDPEIDAWEPKKAFPGIPGSPITSFTLNNKGYVYCNNGDLWEYIPNTDEWQIRTRLQVYPPDDYNYYRNRALSFTVNGNEYVLMLAPNEIPQIWIYDNN
ncbi:MAG: hypothetical protein KDD15_26065, partial [Lewinella sp.]|nr:hypothetical protein [Lewinella sp.]